MPTGIYIRKQAQYEYFLTTLKEHGNKDSCLLWPWHLNMYGYGYVSFDGKLRGVHKLALEFGSGST